MKKNFIFRSESEPILLNTVMEELVNDNVKHYKSDFSLDMEALRLNSKEHKSYIWFLRESGTNLMIEKFINVINTNHNHTFNYYKDKDIIPFRIVITKACPKNMYGYIERINLKHYIKKEKPLDKEYKFAHIRLTLNDKTKKELKIPFTEKCYYEALSILELDNEKVQRFEYLAFS